VSKTFTQTFGLFAKCHRGYNSSEYMNNSEIEELSEYDNASFE